MTLHTIHPGKLPALAIVLAACVLTTFAQTSKPKKVFHHHRHGGSQRNL